MSHSERALGNRRERSKQKRKEARIYRATSGSLRHRLGSLDLPDKTKTAIMDKGLSIKQSMKIAGRILFDKAKRALKLERKSLPANKSITSKEKETKRGGKK